MEIYQHIFKKFFVIDAGADESDGQDNQQLFSVVNTKITMILFTFKIIHHYIQKTLS